MVHRYLFPAKLLNLARTNYFIMAGVLERIMQSKKKITKQSMPKDMVPTKVLQLQMAKEILAETFGVSVREVEEMIQMRCDEKESWPESLRVEG
jgi:hypothetical protein